MRKLINELEKYRLKSGVRFVRLMPLDDVVDCLGRNFQEPCVYDADGELIMNYNSTLMACESDFETIKIPKGLSAFDPVYVAATIDDDSMIDHHLLRGDRLHVRYGSLYHDGDVVLACVNDHPLVRGYWNDNDGNTWLLPGNKKYAPILLKNEDDVYIIGKLDDMRRNEFRLPNSYCNAVIENAKRQLDMMKPITDEKVSWVIHQVGPSIKIARMWFAVFRPLTQVKAMPQKGYTKFAERVKKELPNHKKLPNAEEMQKMDVLSFTKDVEEWDEYNAPVSGTRFYKYQDQGMTTLYLLKKDIQINSLKTP